MIVTPECCGSRAAAGAVPEPRSATRSISAPWRGRDGVGDQGVDVVDVLEELEGELDQARQGAGVERHGVERQVSTR